MAKNDDFVQLNACAKKIIERLTAKGFSAFYVGGCVRDFLMVRTVEDIDIATNARPEQICQLFTKTIPVGIQFGVILVIEEGFQFEVATFRKDGTYQDGRHPECVTYSDPQEDAKRRDFTINGLFWDPLTEEVMDYVGGQEDIRRRIIRAIGNPMERFEEDKLRMMRAVRFAARFGFEIEEKTQQAIRAYSHKIHEVSQERIRDELVKMLTDAAPASAIRYLDQFGLLEEILPEIAAMKGVEQPPEFHPEGDVYVHTMLLLEKLQHADKTLALAALFHDVGKPLTQTFEDRIRFNAHEHVGARMTQDIMKRLRFSSQEIDDVVMCVKQHMVFGQVQKMRLGKLKNMIARDTFPVELELHRIDCQSSHGILDNYHFLRAKQEAFRKEDMKPKPFLSGDDLVTYGLKPGPIFKEILEESYLLQLEGKFIDRLAALEWLKDKTSRN